MQQRPKATYNKSYCMLGLRCKQFINNRFLQRTGGSMLRGAKIWHTVTSQSHVCSIAMLH